MNDADGESVEIKVRATIAPKIVLSVYNTDDPQEGPDDEFRERMEPTTSPENHVDVREEAEPTKEQDDPLNENGTFRISGVENLEKDIGNEGNDDARSTVSELTTLEEDKGAEPMQTEEESHQEDLSPTIESETQEKKIEALQDVLSAQSTEVALFDGALLDDEDTEDGATSQKIVDMDDDTVVSHSKSVVDESTKNVDKAEALAKEMERALAESLAGFSSPTPSPSMDEMDGDENSKLDPGGQDPSKNPTAVHETDIEHEEKERLPQNSSAFYYSKQEILKLATSPVDSVRMVSDVQNVGGSSSHSRSTNSSTSLPGSTAVPLRKQRQGFRYRRPIMNSTFLGDAVGTNSTTTPSSSPPLSKQHQFQGILESIVIPALFLFAAVAICRHFFNPWLKVGNGQSNFWALVWTTMCIIAVTAPVFALEYLLLSGLIAGTALQKAIEQYPEVKKFCKDVRRMRLQAGWWYPSEVRSLRKDLETRNAEIILQQQKQLGDDEDKRNMERLISREQEHRERKQLEKLFDGERAGWAAVKEQLASSLLAEKEQAALLQEKLSKQQQRQHELKACKEQMETDMAEERETWNATRSRLEQALKTAVGELEDETKASDLFSQIEKERDEERRHWKNEQEKLKSKIQQAEEKIDRIKQEHETNVLELNEIHTAKQARSEAECKSLKETLKDTGEQAKAVKEDLECQICKLKDTQDAERAEIEKERSIFRTSIVELQEERDAEHFQVEELEHLVKILKEERTEWNSTRANLEKNLEVAESDRDDSRQRMEGIEKVLQEERAAWKITKKNQEDEIEAAKDEAIRVKINLDQQLLSKRSKIVALEGSIAQLENIILIQSTVEQKHAEADREADRLRQDIPFVGDVVQSSESIESIEVSASNVTSGVNTCNSNASSYYSMIQKVQETHSKEQRVLVRGLLTQHLRCQIANRHVGQLLASSRAMLEATDLSSENSEAADTFGKCLMQYTAASISAKRYMDELISKTGHEDILEIQEMPSFVPSDLGDETIEDSIRSNRSLALASNPWLRNAPLWEQLWSSFFMARTSPLRICHSAVQRLCSGILSGNGGVRSSIGPSRWGISSLFLRTPPEHNPEQSL